MDAVFRVRIRSVRRRSCAPSQASSAQSRDLPVRRSTAARRPRERLSRGTIPPTGWWRDHCVGKALLSEGLHRMWTTSKFGAGDYQAMSWHRELATVVILSSKMMVVLEDYPFGVLADHQTRRDRECCDLSARACRPSSGPSRALPRPPAFALVVHAWPAARRDAPAWQPPTPPPSRSPGPPGNTPLAAARGVVLRARADDQRPRAVRWRLPDVACVHANFLVSMRGTAWERGRTGRSSLRGK